MGKAGKDHEQRRSVRECGMPTTLFAHGLAGQVVVAMISPITRRRSKGPVDMVVSGVMDWIGYCQLVGYEDLICHFGLSCGNHSSEPLQRIRSVHQTKKGRLCMIVGQHV